MNCSEPFFTFSSFFFPLGLAIGFPSGVILQNEIDFLFIVSPSVVAAVMRKERKGHAEV